MLLELSPDQEVFRETTAKFLDDRAPVTEIRRLRTDPAGFDRRFWRSGCELGWTSLLVSEEQGGGTISGRGAVDLSLIAYEFGRRAAPGPLVANNVVASALGTSGSPAHAPVLAELLSGDQLATWCYSEPPPHDRLGTVNLQMRVEGKHLVLNGFKRPVEFAEQSHQLLVTGHSEGGLTQALVPTDCPGVRIEAMHTIDLTRRFAAVEFDDVRVPVEAVVGEIGRAQDDVERQLQLALVIMNAESTGAMQSAFDMTVEWAFDRYSFGRPLASYQEIKHRFADMMAWLEASHAISDSCAESVEARSGEASELASAGKAFIGEYGTELVQDCVQLHGGIGVTFEHDLHLFLRRVTVNRLLYGTPAEHRQRVARKVILREDAA
ncbi:MAG TPA: acyl-CoA dehydrogenase family protein [Acidimicrobiales bacterium]|nr:acyl-CoA dehydrogenase family protein [Acidimicrobiales bacterium]